MTTTEHLVDTYLTAYAEPDDDRRAQLIAEAFAPGAVLADPPFQATGHDELHASFAAVQQQFPGHRFTRTSAIDEHHDTARYTWALADPQGTPAVSGTDVVSLLDGRITRVVGFFGELEAS